jgi:hypothetical protein
MSLHAPAEAYASGYRHFNRAGGTGSFCSDRTSNHAGFRFCFWQWLLRSDRSGVHFCSGSNFGNSCTRNNHSKKERRVVPPKRYVACCSCILLQQAGLNCCWNIFVSCYAAFKANCSTAHRAQQINTGTTTTAAAAKPMEVEVKIRE